MRENKCLTSRAPYKVETIIAPVHSDVEIETAINALGRDPEGADHIGGGPKQRTGGL